MASGPPLKRLKQALLPFKQHERDKHMFMQSTTASAKDNSGEPRL